MDLHRPVVRLKQRAGVVPRWRRVSADGRLQPVQQRRLLGFGERMVHVVGARRADQSTLQHDLHLVTVASPRAQQGVAHIALVVDAPRRWRRLQCQEVNIAMLGQGAQHVEVARRQTGQPEQREPRRKIGERRIVDKRFAPIDRPLGRARRVHGMSQTSPQLGLPSGVLGKLVTVTVAVITRGPSRDHRRTMHGVVVVEIGDVAHRGEPSVALGIVGIAGPEVACQHVEPPLVEIGLDHVEQCPRQPLGPPGIGGRVDTGCRGKCRLDHCPREGESEIGAHAVSATRMRTQPSREAVSQPSLDTARMDSDDLGNERIGYRRSQQVCEHVGQHVGAFGPVHHERHPRSSIEATIRARVDAHHRLLSCVGSQMESSISGDFTLYDSGGWA